MPPARLAAHGAAEALRQRSTMLSRNHRTCHLLGNLRWSLSGIAGSSSNVMRTASVTRK
jgi:hypothetical protein